MKSKFFENTKKIKPKKVYPLFILLYIIIKDFTTKEIIVEKLD